LNALLIGERRKLLTPELTEIFIADLNRLPVELDQPAPANVFDRTQALCRKHRLTAYDAAYLEIAMRDWYSLATVDDDLRRAAIAERVPIL